MYDQGYDWLDVGLSGVAGGALGYYVGESVESRRQHHLLLNDLSSNSRQIMNRAKFEGNVSGAVSGGLTTTLIQNYFDGK